MFCRLTKLRDFLDTKNNVCPRFWSRKKNNKKQHLRVWKERVSQILMSTKNKKQHCLETTFVPDSDVDDNTKKQHCPDATTECYKRMQRYTQNWQNLQTSGRSWCLKQYVVMNMPVASTSHWFIMIYSAWALAVRRDTQDTQWNVRIAVKRDAQVWSRLPHWTCTMIYSAQALTVRKDTQDTQWNVSTGGQKRHTSFVQTSTLNLLCDIRMTVTPNNIFCCWLNLTEHTWVVSTSRNNATTKKKWNKNITVSHPDLLD